MNNQIIGKIQLKFPNKSIMKIIDYAEKNLYVVYAIPKGREKDAGRWLDGIYGVDKTSMKIVPDFSVVNFKYEPQILNNLPEDRIIFER